jgi:hypothetical protein
VIKGAYYIDKGEGVYCAFKFKKEKKPSDKQAMKNSIKRMRQSS